MRVWRRRDGKLFYQPGDTNGESLYYNRYDVQKEEWLRYDQENWLPNWLPVRYRSKRKAERVERDRNPRTPYWTEVK